MFTHGPLFLWFGSSEPCYDAEHASDQDRRLNFNRQKHFSDCVCEIVPVAKCFDADRVADDLVELFPQQAGTCLNGG